MLRSCPHPPPPARVDPRRGLGRSTVRLPVDARPGARPHPRRRASHRRRARLQPVRPDHAPARLGVEIEWHTVSHRATLDAAGPVRRSSSRRRRASTLPGGAGSPSSPAARSSSAPGRSPGFDAAAAILADAARADDRDSRPPASVSSVSVCCPANSATRALHSPRYDAMEAHFDAFGPAGRTMMRQTAAIQVNVDLGAERRRRRGAGGPRTRSVRCSRAAFANSPFLRQRAVGLVLDPARGLAGHRAGPVRSRRGRRQPRPRRGRTTRCARR